MTRTLNFIFTTFLGIFLLIPIGFEILGLKFSSEFNNEKRVLSKFPKTIKSTSELPKWIEDLEAYNNDNMSYRNLMVPAYNTMLYVLNESPTKMIILGKNGWIFNNYNEAMNQLRGKKLIDIKTANQSVTNILKTQNSCAQINIPFFFYVAPNKSSIYPEYLPNHIKVSDTSNFDIFYAQARKQNLNIINIHTCLRSAKVDNPNNQLYYTSDTHWNFSGSYYAYVCLNEAIQTEQSGEFNITQDEIEITSYDKYFGLLERLGTYPIFSDKGENITAINNGSYKRITNDKNNAHITEGRKLSIYENNKVENDLTVLLIGDSFNGYITPYFAKNYHRIIVTPHNGGQWDSSLLDKYKPDIVVYEVLERLLVDGIKRPM